MKLQDALLKAMAKKITWMEAAEIAGVTDRTMRPIRSAISNSVTPDYSIKGVGNGAFTGFRWKPLRRCCGCTAGWFYRRPGRIPKSHR